MTSMTRPPDPTTEPDTDQAPEPASDPLALALTSWPYPTALLAGWLTITGAAGPRIRVIAALVLLLVAIVFGVRLGGILTRGRPVHRFADDEEDLR